MTTAIASPAFTHSAPLAQPRSILIAEDEHLLASDLSRELFNQGYTIVGPASNGRIAVDLAREHQPDLALMDLRMPEMDGIEAGRTIYDDLDIPIVVLSAYSDPQYIDACQAMGVFGYMLKPAEPDDLRITIQVAWGRYLAQRKLTHEISQLERKLTDRKTIEKAKGLLMERLNLTEPESMRRLQKQARDTRRPMVEIAHSILDSDELMRE